MPPPRFLRLLAARILPPLARVFGHGTPRAPSRRITIVFERGRAPADPAAYQPFSPRSRSREGALALQPLVHFSANQLAGLRQRVLRISRSYSADEFPDFASWFQFDAPDGWDAVALAARLRGLKEVKYAYVVAATRPPAVSLAVEQASEACQRHYDPWPAGIGLRAVWNFPGGDGSGVGLVDIEKEWDNCVGKSEGFKLPAVDLIRDEAGEVKNMQWNGQGHGTMVLSVIGLRPSDDGNIQGVGIAPGATIRMQPSLNDSALLAVHDAILAALVAEPPMNFGDVLLLENQVTIEGLANLPAEADPTVHECIRLASACGIVVIEAGGNGGRDLDTVTTPQGQPWTSESGAILVGAAQPELTQSGAQGASYLRCKDSNHGSRVDCCAWGEGVYAAKLDNDSLVPAYFDGTSSASAIIAGAVLVIQGLAKAHAARNCRPFAPKAIHRILRGPEVSGVQSEIRTMPNLEAIYHDAMVTSADLTIRDRAVASQSLRNGELYVSPDIVALNDTTVTPANAFEAREPAPLQRNSAIHVFVRVKNAGQANSLPGQLDVYHIQKTVGPTDGDWHAITPTAGAPLAALAAGASIVIGPIVWQAGGSAAGDYILVAEAGEGAVQDRTLPCAIDARDPKGFDAIIGNRHCIAALSIHVQ